MKDKILYIDDNSDNLFLMKELLEETYDLFCVETVESAFEFLSKESIKVVIADQCMPDISGTDFLILVEKKYPNITKILLTAIQNNIELVINAFERAHIYRFITKPFEIHSLLSTIQASIELYDFTQNHQKLIGNLVQKQKEIELAMNIVQNIQIGLHIYKYENNSFFMIYANPISEKLLGIPNSEKVGKSIDEIFPEVSKTNFIFILHQVIEFQSSKEIESFFYSDSRIPKSFFSLKIFPLPENHVGVSFEDISEKIQAEQHKLTAILETEEKERANFAREMHDGIGPQLSILRMFLSEMVSLKNNPECQELLTKSLEIINQTIQGVIEISHALSPHILRSFGLSHAIKSFCKKIEFENSPAFHLSLQLRKRLDNNSEFILYRITTELINNTLKYAKAKNIYIELFSNDEFLLVMKYADDGIGFENIESIVQTKGLGFFNISNRIKSIGGTVQIYSKKEKGMVVKIYLPTNFQ